MLSMQCQKNPSHSRRTEGMFTSISGSKGKILLLGESLSFGLKHMPAEWHSGLMSAVSCLAITRQGQVVSSGMTVRADGFSVSHTKSRGQCSSLPKDCSWCAHPSLLL
jgi:hypothetical protein